MKIILGIIGLETQTSQEFRKIILLMRDDALQTFKNFSSSSREILREVAAVFRRKCVKLQSMPTAEHKFGKLAFNSSNKKPEDFLEELLSLAKDAFGIAAQAISEQLIYAEIPTHLKKSIYQAYLEKSANEQIVTHLERELELNGLEDLDDLQVKTVSRYATRKFEQPEPTCHHYIKPRNYQNQSRQLKKEEKTSIGRKN